MESHARLNRNECLPFNCGFHFCLHQEQKALFILRCFTYLHSAFKSVLYFESGSGSCGCLNHFLQPDATPVASFQVSKWVIYRFWPRIGNGRTLQPHYNMGVYNTNLDITRYRLGSHSPMLLMCKTFVITLFCYNIDYTMNLRNEVPVYLTYWHRELFFN